MKSIGTILAAVGAIGTILFGIQAAQDSESFSFLGMDVAVSTANWTPVIISAVVLVVGLLIIFKGKKA
jgi:ABC-type spermidine/putrescine transport system permease subunit II